MQRRFDGKDDGGSKVRSLAVTRSIYDPFPFSFLNLLAFLREIHMASFESCRSIASSS
jgi:hypothetical protein